MTVGWLCSSYLDGKWTVVMDVQHVPFARNFFLWTKGKWNLCNVKVRVSIPFTITSLLHQSVVEQHRQTQGLIHPCAAYVHSLKDKSQGQFRGFWPTSHIQVIKQPHGVVCVFVKSDKTTLMMSSRLAPREALRLIGGLTERDLCLLGKPTSLRKLKLSVVSHDLQREGGVCPLCLCKSLLLFSAPCEWIIHAGWKPKTQH